LEIFKKRIFDEKISCATFKFDPNKDIQVWDCKNYIINVTYTDVHKDYFTFNIKKQLKNSNSECEQLNLNAMRNKKPGPSIRYWGYTLDNIFDDIFILNISLPNPYIYTYEDYGKVTLNIFNIGTLKEIKTFENYVPDLSLVKDKLLIIVGQTDIIIFDLIICNICHRFNNKLSSLDAILHIIKHKNHNEKLVNFIQEDHKVPNFGKNIFEFEINHNMILFIYYRTA
jgi:hypothetical protein